MADIVKGLAPQIDTYSNWVSLNPTLGKDYDSKSYGQIVFVTGSPVGDILVWGNDQTFTASYAAGQFSYASHFNAGNLLSEDTGTVHFDSNISLIKLTDTTAVMTINWPEYPFLGATGLVINWPTGSLRVVSADGVTINREVSESNLSILSLVIQGKKVRATLTDTVSSPLLFSGFTAYYQPIFLIWDGSGGSIELI
jgi:hypothetical protein